MNTPTRICPICKTAITPGERFCGNCGTPFPEPTAVDPTQMSVPPPSSQPQQVQYNEAPPPYGATSYGANMPPPPNSGYNPTVPAYDAGSTPSYGPSTPSYEPTPPAPNYGPSSPSYNASGYTPSSPTYGPSAPNYEPTPPAYNPSAPAYGPSSPAYNPPPAFTPSPAAYPYQPGPQTPPKRSRTGLIVGIIVAVTIVVIAACGGTIFLISRSGNSTANTNNTATTGTNPTATALPTATPIPKPQVLFSDNFANNDKNWDVGSSSGLSITIDNNQMTLKEANQKRLDEEIPTNQSYGDFSLTAKVTLISGDGNDRAGFRFRASGDDLGYFVRIFGDNTYDIHKVYQDSSNQSQDIELVNVTSSAALNVEGQVNVVQVVAKGSTIVLYFNGTKVQTVTDTSFSSGPIFLNAGNGDTSKGVVASFSSVELDAAPATLS